MSRILIVGFISFLFLTSTACLKTNSQEEFVFNVNNEFEISIKEVIGEEQRTIEFTLKAVDPQNCDETELFIQNSVVLEGLSIDLLDIIIPEQCETQESYPEGSVQFNVSSRLYPLQINIQDIVNHKGSLQVNDDSYSMGLYDSKGLIPTIDYIYRIPDDFVWGYVHFENNSLLHQTEEVLDLLRDKFTEAKGLNTGHYSYFEVLDNSEVYVLDSPEKNCFGIAFENVGLKEFQLDIMNLKSSYPDLDFHFFDSEGSSY